MNRYYQSKVRLERGVTGWIVGWMSNQLAQALPQWPRLRVVAGQELTVSIEPSGGRFGLRCDSNPANVQVTAIIRPDEQPENKVVEYLLPFPPFRDEELPPIPLREDDDAALGVAGDCCEPGNECGRLGCKECQQ